MLPLSGPAGEKDFGLGMDAAFDSGVPLWQGAPLAGFDGRSDHQPFRVGYDLLAFPAFLILLKGFEAHGEA